MQNCLLQVCFPSVKLPTCCTCTSSKLSRADQQQEVTELQHFLSFIPARGEENEMGIVFSSENIQELVILSATVDLSLPSACLLCLQT